MPSMIKADKPTKKYQKSSLSKLEIGHIEKGVDDIEFVVTLNKLGRKFWKKK